MRERRARRESLADARPRHREATTRARTSFAGDRAVGATRGVGDARRGPFESHSSRSDGPRRGKRHVMGLHHASLRIVCVTCTRGFLFFVPVVHAFLPVVYTFVSLSRYVLVFLFSTTASARRARDERRRWETSGVRRADVDARRARSIDRSIDFVSSRFVSVASIDRNDRARARARVRVRARGRAT